MLESKETDEEQSAWALVKYTDYTETSNGKQSQKYRYEHAQFKNVGANKGDYTRTQLASGEYQYTYVGKDADGKYKGDYVRSDSYSYNYSLTPLNNYVDFTKILERIHCLTALTIQRIRISVKRFRLMMDQQIRFLLSMMEM